MADPVGYDVQYDFSAFQVGSPTTPLPAPALDNELANIETAINGLVGAVEDVRRADGALKNGIVTVDSLAPEIAGLGRTTAALNAAAAAAAAASTSAAVSAASAAVSAETAAGFIEKITVFAFIGDSNMVGQGSSASSPTVPSGVLQFKTTAGTISAANDPVGDGFSAAATGSCIPSFGLEYNRITGNKVLLIPMGRSGSTQAAPNDNGNGNWSATGALLPAAIASVHAAMAAATAAGYNPTLGGIISEAGINDSGAGATPILSSLQASIAAWRAAFGATLQFYIIRTGRPQANDTAECIQIRADTETVAAADKYAQIVYYGALDFPTRGLLLDAVHWGQAALNEVGAISAMNVHLGALAAAGGSVALAGDKSVSIGGIAVLALGASWTFLFDAEGLASILLGSSLDAHNYYRNASHVWQSRGGALDYGSIDNVGFRLIVPWLQGSIGPLVTGQKSAICFNSNASLATNSTYYFGTGSGGIAGATQLIVPAAGTARNFRVQSLVAPGAGQTYTYTLQKNGADTALTCTISGASAGAASDTAHTATFAAGDGIAVKVVTSNGSTATYHAAGVQFDM